MERWSEGWFKWVVRLRRGEVKDGWIEGKVKWEMGESEGWSDGRLTLRRGEVRNKDSHPCAVSTLSLSAVTSAAVVVSCSAGHVGLVFSRHESSTASALKQHGKRRYFHHHHNRRRPYLTSPSSSLPISSSLSFSLSSSFLSSSVLFLWPSWRITSTARRWADK